MTARMEVRYRKPIPLGDELIVRAAVTRERGRILEGTAEVCSLDGDRLADAKAMFVRLPKDRERELQQFFLGEAARA